MPNSHNIPLLKKKNKTPRSRNIQLSQITTNIPVPQKSKGNLLSSSGDQDVLRSISVKDEEGS